MSSRGAAKPVVPGLNTLQVFATRYKPGDEKQARLSITFGPEWRDLLPDKVIVSGDLIEGLLLRTSDAGFEGIRHGTYTSMVADDGKTRLQIHRRYAGFDLKPGDTLQLAEILGTPDGYLLRISAFHSSARNRSEAPLGSSQEVSSRQDGLTRLRLAVEELNSTAAEMGAKLRVDNGKVRAALEI